MCLMPATVVVGGQFGSEGKGKIAHYFASRRNAAAVVRVGGPNSGHTVVVRGERHVFRQLPAAALIPGCLSVIGPGSYVDPAVLLAEVGAMQLRPEDLVIDENAVVITAADRENERAAELDKAIGSTCSGTGSAVI